MKKKNNLQAYAFLTPFLILVTLLYILPAVLTVVMAFTGLDKTFVWKFVGMKNFRRVFMDPNTPIIVRNTLIYVGVCISATLVIDLFFAIMTTYFIKVIRAESQMKLAFAKIIFLRMIAQPRQFQFKGFGGVRHIDDGERTVRSIFAAHFMKAKRLAIKGDGCVQIADIVVFMNHGKGHRGSSLMNGFWVIIPYGRSK